MYSHHPAKELFLSKGGIETFEECKKRYPDDIRIQESIQAVFTILQE
jgi:hypothetical protein